MEKELMTADTVTFGVELETGIPQENINFQIGSYHHGIALTTGPMTADGNFWRAERDGSLRFPVSRGVEFVSPILRGESGVQNLLDMIRWIKDLHNGRTNDSCGLHIHIGIKSVLGDSATPAEISGYVAKLAAVVNINTQGIYAQTGKLRDANRYCCPLSDSIGRYVRQVRSSGNISTYNANLSRYHILNLNPLPTRGTFEFRAFAGTLNSDLILHHLWTCLFIAKFAQALQKVPWTGRGWNSESGGTGTKALKGLHHKMKKHCLVGAMRDRIDAMKAEALKRAAKYDLAHGEEVA